MDFTGGLNFSQVSSYLVYLDTDYTVYINLLDNIAYEPLQDATNIALISLNALLSNDTLLNQCLDTTGMTPTDQTNTFNYVKGQLYDVYDKLSDLNSTSLPQIHGNMSATRVVLTDFYGQANQTAVTFLFFFFFFSEKRNK